MQGTIAGLPTDQCPLWGTPAIVDTDRRFNSLAVVVDSDRAGGRYVLLRHVAMYLPSLDLSNKSKAQITTWLVDRRREGTEIPELTRKLVDRAWNGELRSLLPSQKAELLLRRLAQEMPNVGEPIEWPTFAASDSAAASCAAESKHEVRMLLQYLRELRYVTEPPHTGSLRDLMLTAQGYQRIAELEMRGVDSKQVFVAMWFHDETKDLYDALVGAIEEAGYTPYRVDKPSHEDESTYEMKVCDRIEVEIRRSKLVVADFTHGAEGARGGVYYEAGLARGLGIPVIWTCREDMFKDKLHFNTRQYPHIGWKQEELPQFKQQLLDRIEIQKT